MKKILRNPSFRRKNREGQRKWSQDEDVETIDFLKYINYFTRLRDEFSEVEIDVLSGRVMIQAERSSKQFDEVVEKCRMDLSKIKKRSEEMSLGETRIYDIIVHEEAQNVIQNILVQEKIDAKVTPCEKAEERYKCVRIVALGDTALRRAKEVIAERFVHAAVKIPEDIDLSKEAGKLKDIEEHCSQIQLGKPIKVHVESSKRSVELVGLPNMVEDIKSSVEKLLESQRVKTEKYRIEVSNNFWDFFYDHFRTKVKPIEKQLDSFYDYVTINLTEQRKVLLLEGTTYGLTKCKEQLQKLIQTVVQKDETIISTNVQNLFASGQAGESKLRRIEKNKNVSIREILFVDLPQECKKEGVKILMKHGRIENEVADILVNSAPPDLNFISQTLNVLKKRGGPAFIEECKQHTDISHGDIVYTGGGNLACKYVIHAVGQRWNNNEPSKSKDFLRGLIKKILKKCIELEASSVAMPIIGAGKLGYSYDLVVEIIREEVIQMFTEKESAFSLKDVRVIVFEEDKFLEKVSKNCAIESPDKIILQFIGEHEDVDESFAKVKKFLEKNREDCSTPDNWIKQPKDKVVHLVDLEESSTEFNEILLLFKLNWNDKNTEMKVSVKKIQKIQNRGLYSLYMTNKGVMEGRENEMILFHGTSTMNIPQINAHNFSRSYTGNNGGSMSQAYGQGVYFAKESSYASRFCRDDDGTKADLSCKDLHMYVVKVLVGEFTVGRQEMKAPPSRNDPDNPGLQFDSVVNDVNNPTIFVIFGDTQCYPEYIITFQRVQRNS